MKGAAPHDRQHERHHHPPPGGPCPGTADAARGAAVDRTAGRRREPRRGSLVRNEIALAKSEVKVSVKAGGLGVALFAAAGFVLVLGIIMLSVAIAYFLHMTGMDLAWCFLIVFVLYALIAGVLGYVGYTKVRKIRAPERAIHQAQETKRTLTNRG